MSDDLGYFRVVNLKGAPEYRPRKGEKTIVMDRTHPILGNKHPMKVKTWQERDRVIALFRQDLEADFLIEGPMYQAIFKIAQDIVNSNIKICGSCH